MAKAPYESDSEVKDKSRLPAVDKDITEDISATQNRLAKLRQAAKDRAARLNSALVAAKSESTDPPVNQDKIQQPKSNTVENLPKEAQNNQVLTPEIQQSPPEKLITSILEIETYNKILAERKVPEQPRLRVAEAQAQLTEDAINNPALLDVQLAAMKAARQAATGQSAEPASWVEKTGKAPTVSVAIDRDIPPPPTKAPALYAERENKREGVDKFVPRAYAPWIVSDPKGGRPILTLQRKLIEELDPACDSALTAWPGNHKGQEFPVQIARKNAVEPVSPEEAKEARQKANRAGYLRRREARQNAGAAKGT